MACKPIGAGIGVAKLMSWSERLASLRDLHQFELAILVGLDILQAASAPGSALHLWKAEGLDADPSQVLPYTLAMCPCDWRPASYELPCLASLRL